jgi:fatty acid desaturase
MNHPHDLQSAAIPERLPAAEIRRLSTLSPALALGAIATEWGIIGCCILLAHHLAHPLATLAAIIVIGARQHALLVISHDASHLRLLPGQRWNDWVANVFLAWPMFISVQGFRHFHGPHHRFLAAPGDGNRPLWNTHDAEGKLSSEWCYPKSPGGLAWTILRRAAVWTGLWWILRGIIGGFQYGMNGWEKLARLGFLAAVATALTLADAWMGFLLYWVVPYCTWHIAAQYIRLICEHSHVQGAGAYQYTRTTIPTALERFLVLPRNIGYHIEHHWYPSVPFYRLPELHARLLKNAGFATHAVVNRSVWTSLRQVVVGVDPQPLRGVEKNSHQTQG